MPESSYIIGGNICDAARQRLARGEIVHLIGHASRAATPGPGARGTRLGSRAVAPSLALALAAVLAAPPGAAAAASNRPLFVDVTGPAGVTYLQHTAWGPPFCIFGSCEEERMTGGAAVADVDGDGDLDLFVTCLDAPDILFRNRGDGTFEDATLDAGLAGFDLQSNGAVFADVDNDGDADLYVTVLGIVGDAPNNRYYLFLNDGTGVFTEDAVARGAAIDTLDDHRGWSVNVGDFDRDGWLDLHTTDWPAIFPSHARLLRNLGAGAPGFFEDVTVAAGVELHDSASFASTFTDLDLDGWPDLAVAGDFGTSRLFWNDGDGTFTDGTLAAGVGTDENGMGSTFGDYDADGDLDWFVTSIYDPDETCETAGCNWGYSGNRLYRNDGNRTFSDATDAAGVRDGRWGWGTEFFDYDNDGDLDLVMTNGVDFPGTAIDEAFNDDPMRMWENDGSGVMTEIAAVVGLTDTASGKGLLVFDYDDDGDLDLFLVNNAWYPRLYRNDGGNANDWLRVNAEGSTSNRDGIGARVAVRLVAGGPRQIREIGTSSHFLGRGELTAHFGLGQGTGPVAAVRVTWPSGKIQEVRDVPRNTTLLVREADCVDGDADAFCAPPDCDDAESSVFPGAVEANDGFDNQCPGDAGHGLTDEIEGDSGFHTPGDDAEYSWTAQPGAATYEAVRASDPQFASGCTTQVTTETRWSDATTPPSGAVLFYLVRALEPFAGSWGRDSTGAERGGICGAPAAGSRSRDPARRARGVAFTRESAPNPARRRDAVCALPEGAEPRRGSTGRGACGAPVDRAQ